MSEFKLCYVTYGWAWFTTAPLEQQWGDDWDDAPYEHNCGTPYEWYPRKVNPQEPYKLLKVAFEAQLDEPDEGYSNSPYSVRDINRGDVAWLRPSRYGHPENAKPIPAGVSLQEFRELIWLAGGNVYERTARPETQEATDAT